MASNTPNLDLLKKDPITDGSQTFNIETMLNENWDKIDSAVGQVREELADIDIPLSDATNGNRSEVAASEKAVGQVMSAAQAAQTTANAANTAATAAQTRADSAFQLGNERKAEVVAALVAKGILASTSESWDSLIAKMAGIIKATGNAIAADLLASKTASNASGAFTGTMPNRGAQNATLTQQGQQYTIPMGYHNGTGKVTADIFNLLPENILQGMNIGGVVGTLPRGKKFASGEGVSNAAGRIEVRGLDFLPSSFAYQYVQWAYYYGAFNNSPSVGLIRCANTYKEMSSVYRYNDGFAADGTERANASFRWYAVE